MYPVNVKFSDVKTFPSHPVARTSLQILSGYIKRPKLVKDFLNDVTEKCSQHYPLLAYLSTKFNDTTLIEIGTFRGLGALALSYNLSNKVISYDIEDHKQWEQFPKNIEFRIKNFFEDADHILQSPLIFFDAGTYAPNTGEDGSLESATYKFLRDNNYRGILILDDIHISDKSNAVWNGITTKKYDLTAVGHGYSRSIETKYINGHPRTGLLLSGTGLVDFSGSCNIINDVDNGLSS